MSTARLYLSFLLLVLTHYISGTVASAVNSHPSEFVTGACRATLYPQLCVHCLSSYSNTIGQSQRRLAHVALTVSLSSARSTSVFVSRMTKVAGIRPRERMAVRDCIENMGDAVDRLNQAVQELGRMGRTVAGQDFTWHMSNVQTWVSAALTNDNTCMDGFSGRAMDGRVKAAIRRRVVYLAQVTSNALALVNGFAAKHKP